ncbi:hypothetical protein Ahy_A02g008575 [Arachis hypogaea]|uniref:Endonuclease/exonuclease/phosphatase domain-containing protein n=1 Tax=Arachis hypogaea TaxID=3818 RepID=A0A445EEM9_ARAHY|nr:hypothetical protein Ahy_A02g008575 [Arachis hypogaea]
MTSCDSNKLRFTKGLEVPQTKAFKNLERRRFRDGREERQEEDGKARGKSVRKRRSMEKSKSERSGVGSMEGIGSGGVSKGMQEARVLSEEEAGVEKNESEEQATKRMKNGMERENKLAYFGDFNDILTQEEKIGLNPKPKAQLEVFRSFVDANKLMDLELKGGKFTWFSNSRNGFITKERLDRVLVNWEWREVFPNAILKAIPAMSSDHSLLVVDMEPKARGKREFKFEAF